MSITIWGASKRWANASTTWLPMPRVSVAGLAGLQRSGQAPQASRPMDRLECCTTPPSPESGDQQQSLPYPAGALCAQPREQGVAPDPGSASHRLAELLLLRDTLFRGAVDKGFCEKRGYLVTLFRGLWTDKRRKL